MGVFYTKCAKVLKEPNTLIKNFCICQHKLHLVVFYNVRFIRIKLFVPVSTVQYAVATTS